MRVTEQRPPFFSRNLKKKVARTHHKIILATSDLSRAKRKHGLPDLRAPEPYPVPQIAIGDSCVAFL
jgi:hypothetical protein